MFISIAFASVIIIALDKKGMIIDIGSQYGDYSIACNKLYNCNDILAFEPLEDNY